MMMHANSLRCAFLFAALLLFARCTRDKPAADYVNINGTIWSRTNLDVTTYANGDSIQYIADTLQWAAAREGAWCWYENKTGDSISYGKLYNWYAVNDPRGLCPQGWHAATAEEWNNLVTAFGGDSVAAEALKKAGEWQGPGTKAINNSGFSALPAGNRTIDGLFNGRTNSGVWWTANEADSLSAWARYMNRLHARVGKKAGEKTNGLACRCVKNKKTENH